MTKKKVVSVPAQTASAVNEIVLNGVKFVRADRVPAVTPVNLSNIVLVRTYSAGVHFGELKSRAGKEAILLNARRLWSWAGACSLSQVAVDGVKISESRISVKVPVITLTEAIEIIPMNEAAAKMMMEAPEWKK